jgi:hypothetical protein
LTKPAAGSLPLQDSAILLNNLILSWRPLTADCLLFTKKEVTMKTTLSLFALLIFGAVMVSFQPGTHTTVIEPEVLDTIINDPITNYPDPFCGITTIEYELEQDTWVTLTVTCPNLQVEILVFGNQEAGMHQVTFDACSKPCGCYIATLQTSYCSEQEIMTKARTASLPMGTD